MATGNSFHSLGYNFRMGTSTLSSIVQQVSGSIWKNVQPIHMPALDREICLNAVHEFNERWDFPNCFGCIDGKHIRIKCPPKTGSLFYNYKQYFSIVLQGVADAKCRFLAIDVGARGKQSDGGVLRESDFYRWLQNGAFNLPANKRLPKSEKNLPLVILGDEAYPLQPNIMRPFPRGRLTNEKTSFNYRLSRARRCIECAFGLLSKKFRVLERAIGTTPERADTIVKAICVLHNMIIDKEGIPPDEFQRLRGAEVIECSTCSDPQTFPANVRNPTRYAVHVRESFMEYFNSHEGAVSWQNARCHIE